MTEHTELETAITSSPELSSLMAEATIAARAYAKVQEPLWAAEDAQLQAEAQSAGKQAWSHPYRPERLFVAETASHLLRAFLINKIKISGAGTDPQELHGAITSIRDEYKGLSPAL